MDAPIRQLVDQVLGVTGGRRPDWANDQAPVLQIQSMDDSIYLIGMIGGKDVGKSSLINALLGQSIARVSGFGEGTRRALAYVFQDDSMTVRRQLDQIIPDQFDLIEHTQPSGQGRVLLDLPDVDSIYSEHVELTRRLLRHMLYPVWVQSIEKYADREPIHLLATVARSNTPENFLFVLTKSDQVANRHGKQAVDELKSDFADRVARACQIVDRPVVYAVTNTDPQAFDFPELARKILFRRTPERLSHDREAASRRQRQTVARWLLDAGLDEKLLIAKRLHDHAGQVLVSRVVEPLVDQVTDRLTHDPQLQAHLVEPTVNARLGYWPIVNMIQATLGPVLSLTRSVRPSEISQTLAGREIASHLRGIFAELVQSDPMVLTLYARDKLWEHEPSDRASAGLQQKLDLAIQKHRKGLSEKFSRPGFLTRMVAPVLTIGVVVWFPILQPILQTLLQDSASDLTRETILTIVELLSASYLLQSVGFLAIYFLILWMWLRWRTTRRIQRYLRQKTESDHPAAVILEWQDQLLEPIRQYVEQLESLQTKIDEFAASAGVIRSRPSDQAA